MHQTFYNLRMDHVYNVVLAFCFSIYINILLSPNVCLHCILGSHHVFKHKPEGI
jgi:hypothetical protein